MSRPLKKIFVETVKRCEQKTSDVSNHYWAHNLAFSQRTSFLSEHAISRTIVMVWTERQRNI